MGDVITYSKDEFRAAYDLSDQEVALFMSRVGDTKANLDAFMRALKNRDSIASLFLSVDTPSATPTKKARLLPKS